MVFWTVSFILFSSFFETAYIHICGAPERVVKNTKRKEKTSSMVVSVLFVTTYLCITIAKRGEKREEQRAA
jgi:hypothetical protein